MFLFFNATQKKEIHLNIFNLNYKMKKLFFLLTALCIYSISYASFVIDPTVKKASDIYVPVGDMKMSLQELSVISIKDFQNLSKTQLGFFERFAFKSAQKKLRNSMNTDGSVKNNRTINTLENAANADGFNVLGFFMGLILGLIGVAIAYIAKDEKDIKRNRIKWAWIGFGTQIALALLIGLIALGSALK